MEPKLLDWFSQKPTEYNKIYPETEVWKIKHEEQRAKNTHKLCFLSQMPPVYDWWLFTYFDYEDIVGKLNFEKFIAYYFTCLIKLCTIEGLFKEYVEYLKVKEDYYFESAETTMMGNLNNEQFAEFKKLLELEAEQVKEKDYGMHDILTFLLNIAKKKEGNEEKFTELAMKYAPVLGYGDLNQFMEDYEEK